MSLNVNIVHQRVESIVEAHSEQLGHGDENRLRTLAFTALVVSTALDIPLEDAFDYLTDGGQDGGIDAISVGSAQGGEFVVTLVQTKYQRRLDGVGQFPANEIKKLLSTLRGLFDPDAQLQLHAALQPRIEEIRALIRDGQIPVVHVILANNGRRWGADGDHLIETSGLTKDQVHWDHVNPDSLVRMMRTPKKVSDEMQLAGQGIIESFDFCRVLVGKIPVADLARLFEKHGDALLDRNVRRYLGFRSNRVNRDIAATLRDPEERKRFYFYNNGITVTCSKFRHNALQAGNFQVKLDDLQVVNGGQTCHTIRRIVRELPDEDFSTTYVMLRIYELDDDQRELVRQITYATNSQNPVDLRDLRANDEIQRSLEVGLKQLGYNYVRQRGDSNGTKSITPTQAAEAVLAVWRKKPHLARSGPEALFGTYYNDVFSESLTPQKVIVAVELLRKVRSHGRSHAENLPKFAPYASHFLAMLIGEQIELEDWPTSEEAFELEFRKAMVRCRLMLAMTGIDERTASLQRLSGAFRRGDLISGNNELSEARARKIAAAYWATVAEVTGVAERSKDAMKNHSRALERMKGRLDSVEPPYPDFLEVYRELMELVRESMGTTEIVEENLRSSERKIQSVGPNDALFAELVLELNALRDG